MSKKEHRKTERLPAGGIDPSAFSSPSSDRKAQRKTQQLCREARDVLSIALAELHDAALDGAWVAEVLAGADSAHLRVIVMAPAGVPAEQTLDALRRASGLLRREVAQAIARKRTPLLTFEVHEEVQE
jgi:ribosome-binding factor A